MRVHRFLVAALLAAATLALTAGRGEAQAILGGSFEAPPGAPGYPAPWGVFGDTGTVAGVLAGIPPWAATLGAQFAVLTNAAPGQDIPPVPPAYSGAAALFAGAPIAAGALEGLLGMPGGSLALGPGGLATTEGSGILHPGFFVAAPTTLSFDALYATNENFRAAGLPVDFAFVSIDGGAPFVLFAGPQPNGLLPPNGLFGFDSLAFGTFTTPVLGVGVHTIAFGVLDTLDSACSSALFLDNLRLNPVPEPASVLAASMLVAGLAYWTRRLRKESLARP